MPADDICIEVEPMGATFLDLRDTQEVAAARLQGEAAARYGRASYDKTLPWMGFPEITVGEAERGVVEDTVQLQVLNEAGARVLSEHPFGLSTGNEQGAATAVLVHDTQAVEQQYSGDQDDEDPDMLIANGAPPSSRTDQDAVRQGLQATGLDADLIRGLFHRYDLDNSGINSKDQLKHLTCNLVFTLMESGALQYSAQLNDFIDEQVEKAEIAEGGWDVGGFETWLFAGLLTTLTHERGDEGYEI